MRTFILVVTFVLGFVWSYIWLRLVEPTELAVAPRILLLVVFMTSFALQPARFVYRDFFHGRRHFQLYTYALLGFMAQLFVATLVKDIFLLLTPFTAYYDYFHSLPARRLISLAVLLLTLAANLWGVRTAWRGPSVQEVEVELPHWPAGAPPLRLAQISDLHVGPLIRKAYVEKVVARLNELQPQVVAITGDLGDAYPSDISADLEPLSRIRAEHGIFYVLGNHEFYWNPNAWIQKGRELGFRVLTNEGQEIPLHPGTLWMAGVPDYSSSSRSDPESALPPTAKRNQPKILLAHQPKSVFAAARAGFDLMLSGHTHNGQFFPFNLIVGRFNPYSKGLNHHGDLQVYVNVGTGFWGPPLRLFVPAEITLLTLRGRA